MGTEQGLSSPLCQGMFRGNFFFKICAITKENCTEGKTKVQTLSETSSQESAGTLKLKPISLSGLCILLDSCVL